MSNIAKVVSSKMSLDREGNQRSYTGQHGTLYYSDVELDNGVKGQVGSKNPGVKWNPGDTVQFTYTPPTDPKYPGKLKLERPKEGSYSGGGSNGGGSSEQKSSGRSFDQVGVEVGHAITNAVALLSIGAKVVPSSEAIKEKAWEILALSDELKAERRAQQGEPKSAPAPAQQAPAQGKPTLTQELADKFIERVKKGDANATMESLTSYYDVPNDLLGKIATAILLSAKPSGGPSVPANVPDGIENLPF